MNKFHEVAINEITVDYLAFTVDGSTYRVLWLNCSKRLCAATHEERAFIDISPSGYGLHWPLIDEDLAIDPLLTMAERLSTEDQLSIAGAIVA